MYFLIDYENVNYAGLEGTEFLEKNDTVSFFFSAISDRIIRYRMMDIEKSGCNFEICKLRNVRKNALDFYIASKVGEIFTMDCNAKVAIISADNDYRSLIDYWKPRLAVPNQLVLTKTIANAIKLVNGEGVRKAIVNHRMQVLDLHMQYIKYEEKKRLADTLEGVLDGTEYGELVPRLVDMIMETDQPRILYLNSLKSFGRKSGTEVYRRIRDCVAGVQRVGELEVW